MENVNITNDSLEKILSTFLNNASQERELALDRYRRQDEMMTSPEDFVLQGKCAVDYLKTASERSNSLLSAAKLIKDILYKDNDSPAQGGDLTDDVKKLIIQKIKEKKEANK